LLAALAIFEHARRLARVVAKGELQQYVRSQQADAYLLAINALHLLDPSEAWIVVQNIPNPSTTLSDDWTDNTGAVSEINHSILSRVIPTALFADSTVDHEIVDISHIRRELLLIRARIDLVDFDPTLTFGNGKYFNCNRCLRSQAVPESLFAPVDVVLRYRDLGLFDRAFALANGLRLPLLPILQSLVDLYIRLKRSPNAEL
jgi:hypothetical protein